MPYRARMAKETIAYATELRASPTAGEAALWQLLRTRRLDGWRFRRQVPILGWIVDFYCPAAHLAIEIDGPSHRGREHPDLVRDTVFLRHGILTLRFSERQCRAQTETVAAGVLEALQAVSA